jgi:DNA-binding beta-propeller fold protein YncE
MAFSRRFAAILLLGTLRALLLGAGPANYTYNYDYWNQEAPSPDAYRVGSYLLGTAFGIGGFRDPQGLFIRENRIYICDSGNNRIVLLEADTEGNYRLDKIVSSVLIDGMESPLSYPRDIFETREGEIYIADTNNQRVLRLDRDWNYIASILKPVDGSIDAASDFLPAKLTLNFAGRLFVQAVNVNKGLMEFDNRGSFVGFMGANKVYVNAADYIWKFISTQAQRGTMDLFIPTEYNNLCVDDDGFIYVTNSTIRVDPVRRLNAMGQDILIRNGYEDPEGDLEYGNAGGINGPSKFIDVTALENGSYACFDRVRGRIFVYDFQGNLLYAFGGVGNREGSFVMPAALDHMGSSLFALDSRMGSLTRFDLTLYGERINRALGEYKAGHYEESAALWEEVLKMNGNYDLAYIGIGRAAFRRGDYRLAMEYYKLKRYSEGYGKAFQYYRKQWMEENLWKILLFLGFIILAPPLVRFVIRFRKEIGEA